MKKIFAAAFFALLSAGCMKAPAINPAKVPSPATTSTPIAPPTPTLSEQGKLTPPINNALSRVAKKPFGIYITPKTSPIQPEKFFGYHTGTDFETTDEEQNTEVEIYAACDGKLLQKRTATGYGGVAIQSCKLNSQEVTVLYGHIKLSSLGKTAGQEMKAGEQIAILGKGYSSETSNERKHLHFSIHKGTNVALLGYVQKQSELSAWLNPLDYLK